MSELAEALKPSIPEKLEQAMISYDIAAQVAGQTYYSARNGKGKTEQDVLAVLENLEAAADKVAAAASYETGEIIRIRALKAARLRKAQHDVETALETD